MHTQIDILLSADVFENFWKVCLKIYALYPFKVLSTPGLAWQAVLKKTQVKLDLLSDIDMLWYNGAKVLEKEYVNLFIYI